jgi:hypothetical protein
VSDVDPLPVDEVPPPAVPPPPAYDTTDRLEPTPAYDALAAEAPMVDPLGTSDTGSTATGGSADFTSGGSADFTSGGIGEERALSPEADYALAPNPTAAGPLGQVKTLAAEKPAIFLGAALAAGWLLGKITSRGSRDD